MSGINTFSCNCINILLQKMDFSKNPVVISAVCVLAGLLTVVFLFARRWDQLDTVKVSKMPLCGKDAAYKYEVTVITGRQLGAGKQ